MAGGEDVLVVAPGGGRDALLLVAQESAWRNSDGAGDGDDDDYGMLNFRPGLDGGDDDDGFPYETITMWLVVVFLAMCLYGLTKLVLAYVPASWIIIHRGFLIDPARAHYCCFELLRTGKLY
ncbi:Os12g0627900 [Oryza sativa Japonica Group]|uniref:Os12g0627900 protein n=3 Tax=Oryza TaxID=4527 RepID=Q2QLU0_ORYSJ|nr:hypothetical protein LOC_Os12g43320 [Oryza sativa Japonica Group]EAZ21295.1 hypothetical protein OsJ_36948 [Oryza sativa Japonica Group]BAT18193.1 Os12g0627900 [Oryza sativa Japonica Group]